MEMLKFEQLPNEMLLKIFSNRSISEEDSVSISKVCKRFQNVLQSEDKFWKSKIEKRWPSVINFPILWNLKTSNVENWEKEVEDSLKIRKKLEETLNNLNNQPFTFKKMPWSSILTSIYETINVENFGQLIALNEIGEIIKEAREETRVKYLSYARKLLFHLNYHLLWQEMKHFLQLPPARKTLEKVVYYISKLLNPEDFLDYQYEEISSKLDKLAHEVQSYLRTINPRHPAISVELFSPEEPLKNSKWSDEESYELFKSINHVLCLKHIIGKYNSIYNIFLHRKVEGSPVNDRYFTTIYMAVSHRLGIPLQPIDYKNKLLFRWKTSSFEYGNILHPYNHLNLKNLSEQDHLLISQAEYSIEKILMDFSLEIFYESKGFHGVFQDGMAAVGMILLLQIFTEDSFRLTSNESFVYCLKNQVFLEEVIQTCDEILFNESPESQFSLSKIEFFSSKAKRILAHHRRKLEQIKT